MSHRLQRLAWPMVVMLLLVGVAGAQPTTAASQPAEMRILFIGNSYTAYNGGLYKLLPMMARERGRRIECVGVTVGGKSLEYHYNQGKARSVIAQGGWDWVVLQDYSLQPLNKKDVMFEYARKFDADIRKVGAKTAFYMTWAREDQPEKQQIITDAYTEIARELGATLVPCGRVWERARKEHPGLQLHRPDKSHPNADATYLNACMFFCVLLKEDPRGLAPMTIKEEGKAARPIAPETTRLLQDVAAEAAAKP